MLKHEVYLGLVRMLILHEEAFYAMKDNKIIMLILCLLLPPVAVFLKSGVGTPLIINIILCIFFYVPGIVHALWVSFK